MLKKVCRRHLAAGLVQALLLMLALPVSAGEGVVIRAADKMILDRISLHKQNYVLPFTYRDGQGDISQSELIFQFSAKLQAFMPNLYAAYTQTSFWQFLDTDNSSPFRETNYNPEIFYHLTPDRNRWGDWGAYIGVEHESNGQSLPSSRSWDRFYFWPYWNSSEGEYSLKLWLRRPEENKDSPDDTEGDDNPDIENYLGYCEFYFYRFKNKGRSFSGMLRGNTATSKGAIQLDYSWPLTQQNTYFFARLFGGYGESLIDYNERVLRLSFGFEFR